jgi:hypothetical protein
MTDFQSALQTFQQLVLAKDNDKALAQLNNIKVGWQYSLGFFRPSPPQPPPPYPWGQRVHVHVKRKTALVMPVVLILYSCFPVPS